MRARVRVQLLGRPAITGVDGPMELRGPRQAGLLALLGAEIGRVVRTSRIEDELWDGQLVSESAVRVNVNRLRSRFVAVAGSDPIASHTLGYALDLDLAEVDITAFADDARAAADLRRGGHLQEALARADAAERHWRGRSFEGVSELPSVRPEHERLEAMRQDTWQERASALLEVGALDDALAQLDALILAAPYREVAWGLRLVALARHGRRDEALLRYQELVELLGRDLAIAPDPSVVAVADAIRAGSSDPPADHLLRRRRAASTPTSDAPAPPRRPTLQSGATGSFVGRAALVDELAALAAERGRADEAPVVVVEGPPGIGKTRLASEVAARVSAQGITVLAGTCPRDGGSGLTPIADILDGALAETGATDDVAALAPILPRWFPGPATAPDPDPQIRRLQLFDAATVALAAAGRSPLLVVVDDVQWICADAARFLQHLIPRVDATWLLLARVADRSAPAVEVLADIGARARWHTLDPLTDDEVAELVRRESPDATTTWARTVADRAGGNPFFVTEVLRHGRDGGGDDQVPHAVEQLVLAGTARLPADAKGVAHLLAVAGEPVTHAALADAADLDGARVDAALAELVAAGFANGTTDRPRLAHDLVAEALDATIGPGERRGLHVALGRALTRDRAASWPTALAHLLAAGSEVADDEVDRAAALAFHQLNASTAYDEAVRLGGHYLEARGPEADSLDALDARIQVATAMITAGPYGRGRALLDAITPDVRRQGDAALSADAILAAGAASVANPDLPTQIDEARLVLDALDAGHVRRRVQLASLIAHHLALLGRSREALQLLDRAEVENEAAGTTNLHASLLALRTQVAAGSTASPARARAAFGQLESFAADHPSAVNLMWLRMLGLDQAMRDGTLDDHGRAVDELEELVARFPRAEVRWAVSAGRAGNALARGDLDLAERLIVDAQVTGGELSVGSSAAVWVIQLFQLQYERGDVAMMTPFLSSLADNSSPFQLTARALVHLEAGDHARARQMAEQLARRDAVLAEGGAGWTALAGHLGDIAWATGHEDLAANVVSELGAFAGVALSSFGFIHFGAADRSLGTAWAALGEDDKALDALEQAYTDDRRRGAGRWAARAARDAAILRRRRRRRGDVAAARVLDQEAARLSPV